MSDGYVDDLRGNQEVFLTSVLHSPEFEAIEQKYLRNVFMGLYSLLKRIEGDDESAQKVHACAAEVSEVFRLSEDTALKLLLSSKHPASYSVRYLPHIKREGSEIVMRLHRKTTKKDIDAVWKLVKELQKEIGGSGSKQSINPELAYCIHRQYVLRGRRMVDIYDDYARGQLEGYEGKPSTRSENDFRKYYNDIVEGL